MGEGLSEWREGKIQSECDVYEERINKIKKKLLAVLFALLSHFLEQCLVG